MSKRLPATRSLASTAIGGSPSRSQVRILPGSPALLARRQAVAASAAFAQHRGGEPISARDTHLDTLVLQEHVEPAGLDDAGSGPCPAASVDPEATRRWAETLMPVGQLSLRRAGAVGGPLSWGYAPPTTCW